ncbi:Ig-like domain (group 4) [Promicromonospora umidemergens]|uniref:Bacterial Ig-like domain-containing protein n=1 Tax=Promicromonospora umidemergens TaxID=629679 RepID=A0ABP8XXV7_9MICO|nr:family 43 glycosylhydrolase [Promicromonospora umidemergens]MCP2284199.1 Ig-like domain (group 4) [Promicromonospora umidemergens]
MRQIRAGRPATAGALAAVLAAGLAVTAVPATAQTTDPVGITSTQNPILADGSYYSADPAPVVVPAGTPGNETGADQLYVYTGHDEAGPTRNDFVMNEWGAFVTSDVDAGEWTHHPSLMRPEDVFSWATPGRAYAGEVQQGVDRRYYWYVPVHEAASGASDKFGIGVAVSDSPTGPWTDHAGGPIVSQRLPAPNTIHNIDPTVLVDGVGEARRVHMYWGSFGNLRQVELGQDMKTPVGDVRPVTGLTGFFEAPWLFERDDTYYLAYAGNDAGPTSRCTPANYHACIAYATAPSAEGPWTYRGTVLPPVSSTTSHPGIVELNGEWWIAYHTADAEGGNHFRRSVAIDPIEWDDTQDPPRMLPVTTTPPKQPDRTPRANIAQEARVTVSNDPVPTQYWIKALNDEIVRPNPLPPDMWGTWTGNNPPQQWVQYTWDQPVRVSGSQIEFWNDQPKGSGVGVAAPDAWRLQYWDADADAWTDVPGADGYPTGTSGFQPTSFDAVTTTQLRAVFDASTNGSTYSGVAVEEWKVLAEQADDVTPERMTVEVGETELPGTVTATYPGGHTLRVPAYWDALAAEDVAAPGEITVEGSVLGHAAGRVTTTVTVVDPADTAGDETPPEVTLTPIGSAGSDGWFRSAVRTRVAGTDDGGGRVVLTTSVDGGDPVVTDPVRYTDVDVAGDGEHTVTAAAADRAGNVSPPAELDVRIDATAPRSTAALDERARTVSVTATDGTSGVALIEVAVDGGAFEPYEGPVPAGNTDRHDVRYRAADRAGNTEPARTITIPADLSGPLTGNVAPLATPTASYTAGWNSVLALNDELDPASPPQAQLWGTWSGSNPATRWAQYSWPRPIRLTAAEIKFWADQPQGTGAGVARPDSWELSYWDETAQDWAPVADPSPGGTSTDQLNRMTFEPVTTSRLRATIHANGDGTSYSAVAATEWRVLADDPGAGGPAEPAVTVTAEARCLAGSATLAVRAVNDHDSAVDVRIGTPYGTREVTAVAPGQAAYQSFATRAGQVEDDSVTVRVTGEVDGDAVTREITAPYVGVSC